MIEFAQKSNENIGEKLQMVTANHTLSEKDTAWVKPLIAALKERTLFTVMRGALKQEKLSVGLGWDDVIGHACESTPEGERFRKFLIQYFQESLVTGERYVQIYDIDDQMKKDLQAQMASAVVTSGTFGSIYPMPLTQALLSAAPSVPELCEVRRHENGDISLILCNARFHDDKMSYEAGQLPKHVFDTYVGIDKLITYRKIFYQAYDVVTLRTSLNRIEICIDAPSKSSSSDLEILPLKILSLCAQHVTRFAGMGAAVPANLFPAIAGMYYQSNEGKVMGLSFRTLTGSIKKERMTAESDDLRDEKFHHAGMNALGQKISPYEVTLEYETKIPLGTARLKLSALIRELSSATPTLHGCYVSSSSFACFGNVLNRLVTYLP